MGYVALGGLLVIAGVSNAYSVKRASRPNLISQDQIVINQTATSTDTVDKYFERDFNIAGAHPLQGDCLRLRQPGGGFLYLFSDGGTLNTSIIGCGQ